MDNEEFRDIVQQAIDAKTKVLDLSNMGIENLSTEIGILSDLKELNLKNNQLRFLPPEFFSLRSLRVLILRNNLFTEIPRGIFLLRDLQVLDLAGNQLSDIPSEIGMLSNLRRLYISENKLVRLPPEISKLLNLTGLYLGGNQFSSFPAEVAQLKNLEVLSIRGNLLKYIPATIEDLSSLRELRLDNNQISEIPLAIGNIINQLEKLDLRGNPIPIDPELLLVTRSQSQLFTRILGNRDKPDRTSVAENTASQDARSQERVQQLVEEAIRNNASSLELQNLGLSDFPLEVTKLSQLTWISVNHNRLRRLPSELGNLSNLVGLSCGVNLIEELPSEIRHLKYLRVLRASDNELTTIPKEIGSLDGLRELALRDNHIVELPDEIGLLSELTELDLRGNEIKSLPESLRNLRKLRYLDLRNNPIAIPVEILEKNYEPNAILHFYFSQLGQNRQPLQEAKIILIGQGNVGKTSIVNRLTNGQFHSNENKTEGITISRLSVDSLGSEQALKIKLNLWDFGGQEIMHATHQFFLTKRSLYLLVLDSRLTQEENRVEYWLKIVQFFGGESPVLIVGNKIDQHPLDIDRTGLQKKYPNIVGIFETSAATYTGMEALKAAITEHVNHLPHVRDLLPETWFTVKTRLETLGSESNFITHDRYIELCTENEVSDETSQRTLISFLHDLGVVLHFQDDPRLEALGILNPQWVTNGVYKLLNARTLFQNKGVLTIPMLDEVLNQSEYPRGKRLFLVDMMKKFELCYDIEPDKAFLVPDLLPKDEPKLDFSGIPAFEYAYPVLPSSVITRFIVRMNKKIYNDFVWRTGVLLKIGDNRALVKADIEDRKITIAIDGLKHTRRDALSAIRYQLDEIHNSIKGLDAEKFIPVPETVNAKPLPYNYLLMLEAKGIEILPVPDGNRLVNVHVRQVLSGIESETQRKERVGNVTNIYVGGDIGGNVVVGDENEVANEIQNSFNKIESLSAPIELKETLRQLAEAVDAMNKALPKEQAAEVTEDLSKLVDEVTKPSPNKKWYSVSIEGLIEAAENVERVGEPVINLSRKVLSLLTGGAIK